jgi:hypothetical protein
MFPMPTPFWNDPTALHLSKRLSFSRPTTMLFGPGAPKLWLLVSYQWTMLPVKASMFLLQCIILSETRCGKNAEAAKKWSHFSTFECFLTLCHSVHS